MDIFPNIIRHNIHCKTTDILLRLYKYLIWPHVEHWTVAWSRTIRRTMNCWERTAQIHKNDRQHQTQGLQRKNQGFWLVHYGGKTKQGWLDFSVKNEQGIFSCTIWITVSIVQSRQNNWTRVHAVKLVRHCTRRDVGLLFVSKRVINRLNQLDLTDIEAENINQLKRGLHQLRVTRMDLFMQRILRAQGRIRDCFLVQPCQLYQVLTPVGRLREQVGGADTV